MKPIHLSTALLACALLCTTGLPVQAGPVLDRIRASGKLVIAHRESSVPFSYLDGNGKPVGYAVELCQRLSAAVLKHLSLKLATSTSRPRRGSAPGGRACASCR